MNNRRTLFYVRLAAVILIFTATFLNLKKHSYVLGVVGVILFFIIFGGLARDFKNRNWKIK